MKNLPNIMFATRHPIKDFETIRDRLPDITRDDQYSLAKNALAQSGRDGAAGPGGDERTKNLNYGRVLDPFTNETKNFDKAELIYYGKASREAQEFEFVLKKEDAQKGGGVFDLNPMIMYVAKRGINIYALPKIDCEPFFERSDYDTEKKKSNTLAFSITKSFVDESYIMSLNLKNAQAANALSMIQNFSDDDDLELLRAIDA
jgi:hypothetical protein